jgi:glycosyltransferase involved in cell wall biosynthesis
MKISVIIPCYNHAETIERCLASVFAQTHRDLEVIVVDDGSTDASADLLKRFAGRISVISQENRGGPAARNRGLAASTAPLVMFCDADVILRPDALAKMAEALATRPEASYAYASFKFGWKTFRSWDFDAARLKRMNFIHTTSLIRREHFPGFDESLKRFQDWDVWLTMLAAGRIGTRIPSVLFRVIPRRKEGISSWAPSFLYRLPWKRLGFTPKIIGRYEDAAAIIVKKHGL